MKKLFFNLSHFFNTFLLALRLSLVIRKKDNIPQAGGNENFFFLALTGSEDCGSLPPSP